MARLAAPARLLRLTAVLLLLALPAAPAALAGDGLPARFGVPALHDGDAWTYVVSGPARDGWATVQRSFEARGASTARDADGVEHGTAALVELRSLQRDDEQATEEWTYAVDAAGATVAATRLRDGPGAQATNTITGLPAGQDDIVEDVKEYPVIATTRSGAEPFCGHRNGLQGGKVALPGTVLLQGCPEAGFRALASRDWNGQKAVVLGLASDPARLQAWFVPTLPVPVRLVDASTDPPTVHELVQSSLGQAPLSYGVPGQAPLPAVDLAARPAWGLDESGAAHPFPLKAGFDAARAAEPLAGFFAGHAGAYLASAAFTDLRVNHHAYIERQRQWLLVASDGADAAAVLVTQATVEAPGTLGLAAPPQAPTVDTASAGDGPWPVPAAVPAQAPTVASLARRWQAGAADAGAPNSWGFRLRCAATCDAAALEAWAGRDDSTQPNEPQVGFATATIVHRDADLAAVDAAGRTAWTEQVRFERDYRLAGVPLLSTGDAAPAAVVAPPAAGLGERVPWAPVAAVGAAALLALAAWWLVKAGPFAGLFSRHIADVTAHPVRRAILDAVQAEPGVHHSELLRRVGKGNAVVTNHVRRLLAAGLLLERQGPRFRCYFPAGTDRASVAAGPLVKSPVAQGILAAVAGQPLSGQELARRLGVAPGAVTYHAQRLGQAGLLSTRRAGRFVLLEATPAGRQAVAGGAA